MELKNKGVVAYAPRKGNQFIIPSGCLSLDYGVLRKGGLPTGNAVEIFGDEACGKTTLAMNIAKNVLEMGGAIMLKDTEHWEDARMRQVGIDVDRYVSEHRLYRIEDEFMEDYFSTIFQAVEAIRKNEVDFPIAIIIDSVALSVTRSQYEAMIERKREEIGARARILTPALGVMNTIIRDTPILFLFINQFRVKFEKRGLYTTAIQDTTAGNALRYADHLKIGMNPKKNYVVSDMTMGKFVDITTEKNKISVPGITRPSLLMYNGQFPDWYPLVEEGIRLNVIEQKGSWYTYKDVKGQGKEGLKNELQGEVLEALKEEIVGLWDSEFSKILAEDTKEVSESA
jgi:recombination protein RecA